MKVGDQFLHAKLDFVATVLDIDELKGRITYERFFIEKSQADISVTSLDWFRTIYTIPMTPLLKALM